MTESITDRIIATVPRAGCKIRTLRAVLHDIEAAPLDYAIQGLTSSGRYVISYGFIRPGAVARPAPPARPGPAHPWKALLAIFK